MLGARERRRGMSPPTTSVSFVLHVPKTENKAWERMGRGRRDLPYRKGSVPLIKCLLVDWSNPSECQNLLLFKTSNGRTDIAWLLLACTTKEEVNTLHFCIKLLSQKHERGSVFKQNWPSPMALAACRPWKGRLLSGGDSHFLNTISILCREERWADRITYATGTFSFVDVKTFNSKWRSFRFSHLNISIIRQQKPSWIWLLSSKRGWGKTRAFSFPFFFFGSHTFTDFSPFMKQKGRNLYLSVCTVCVPLITEIVIKWDRESNLSHAVWSCVPLTSPAASAQKKHAELTDLTCSGFNSTKLPIHLRL